MSESSSHSSASSAKSDACGLEKMCDRLNRKAGVPLDVEMAVAEHESIVKLMLKIRDVLLRGAGVGPACEANLACAGISIFKRLCSRAEEDELMRTTVCLVFCLIVMANECHANETGHHDDAMECDASEEDRLLVKSWAAKSLESSLFLQQAPSSSWESALSSDSAVSSAALRCGREVEDAGGVEALFVLASIFFRTSCSVMVASLLSSQTAEEQQNEFLTLEAAEFAADASALEDERILSIVDAAESEAGQAVFRDLILSFRLPLGVVGVRRTLLLSRSTNATATKDYTEILNDAHSCAMRGVIHEFNSEKSSDTVKAAALLAGLAVLLMTKGGGDSIRKADAFAGRVCMPFLETVPCTGCRITNIPSTTEWCVFEMRGDAPKMLLRKGGLNGLKKAVLLLNKKMHRKH